MNHLSAWIYSDKPMYGAKKKIRPTITVSMMMRNIVGSEFFRKDT